MGERVWVQMTISISGGRADGRDWPERWGAAIDLPAEEAGPLIRAGNAIRVDAPDGAQAADLPSASMTPSPVSEPAASARGPVPSPFPPQLMPAEEVAAAPAKLVPAADPEVSFRMIPDDEEPDVQPSAADGMNQPKPADAKQVWVDYAMAHGESEDEANMQTKAQLMQKYGGRI